MNEFYHVTQELKRNLAHEERPIYLLYGGGYESQILLCALRKLRKDFTIVHTHGKNGVHKKIQKVLTKVKQPKLLMMENWYRTQSKVWEWTKTNFFPSTVKHTFGFWFQDVCLIGGFQIGGDSDLRKVFAYNGNELEKLIYCPLLRYSEEWIQTIYQDMMMTEPFGKFLHENLLSDSHHMCEVA